MTLPRSGSFPVGQSEGLGDGGDRHGRLRQSAGSVPVGAADLGRFAAVNLPSVSVWAVSARRLRGSCSDPVRLKWFNIAMGVLCARDA